MNVFDLVNSDEFDGVVRHVVGWFGSAAVVQSNFDPTQWQTIAGGVVAIMTVLWSVANKRYMRTQTKPNA